MVELTVPFWLTSAILPETETVSEWLRSQRVQPRWIDEVVCMTYTQDGNDSIVPNLAVDALQFIWPIGTHSEQYFLQSACREISVKDRRLILLLSKQREQTATVLLASPETVGMYNLMPLAYVEGLISTHLPSPNIEFFEFIDSTLLAKGKKVNQVKQLWVQTDDKRPTKTETPFASAAWVKTEREKAGSLAGCHGVVQALIQKNQSNGLAIEVDAYRQLFATWIERV
ncbi:MAG: hypothetical protein AB9897_04275 [Anaerolineaceae bacterium]